MTEEKNPTTKESEKQGNIEVLPKKKESSLWMRTPYELWSEMDRMFEDFTRSFGEMFWSPLSSRKRHVPFPWRTGAVTYREPYVDVLDTGKEFKLSAEFPGVSKENIEITVTDDAIELSAKAEKEEREEKEDYLRQERGYLEFYRKLVLPEEILPDKANAKLEHGLLEITLPKKEPKMEPKKHKLEIK
ncbi:Hsp20/alpha crystallin family protein [Methanosarcinales archaeon]|nr:MAG: Hsp20/alpha crystallin family protein [Methanosarcinales archaeon]